MRPGPSIASLALAQADAAAALASFAESCPKLLRRTDASGLTRAEDWQPACTAASGWPRSDAARFFAEQFETAVVGDGARFVTGYYEPEIAGSRTRRPGFEVPVYAHAARSRPRLARRDPARAAQRPRAARPLRRERQLRALLRPRADRGRRARRTRARDRLGGRPGRAVLPRRSRARAGCAAPEGEVIRIGYAGQNGRDYVGIGGLLRERGLLGDGPGQYPSSMQGIMQYLREHPAEGHELMRQNLSWIFFREFTGDGPLGALEVPVRRESSVAADPAYTPLGAPVVLTTDRREVDGLWIAQDTGGAIKGPNRFDSFWGAGDEARTIAGGMTARGQALLLLPKGTLARLGAR